MPTVLLHQVKAGDKLTQDVHTKLGGTLFYKGKVLMPREMEILQAFMYLRLSLKQEREPGKHRLLLTLRLRKKSLLPGPLLQLRLLSRSM